MGDSERARRRDEKAVRLRELAAAEKKPDRRERLLDAAAEHSGMSLTGAANDREKPTS